MSQDLVCKLCKQVCPPEAFSNRQRKRAETGRAASCLCCQEAILQLKRQAAIVDGHARGSEAGAELLECVSRENWCIWEQALQTLPDGNKDSEMLRSWLQEELEDQETGRLDAGAQDKPRSDALKQSQCPAWLDELRAERTLTYDVSAFPFPQLFCEMFETSDLAGLHKAELKETPPLCPTLLRAYHLAGAKRPRAWRQKEKWQKRYVHQFRKSPQYLHFLRVYHTFILEVVLPLVGRGSALLFQSPPTLRCQMPGMVPMGKAHRDSDFDAHHGAEINFWIPVTRVWGSNSLQAESIPGKEDFHPFELDPGEMVIFNGSRCLHYTVPNETDSVRVSFDFRVIPECLAGYWRHAVKSSTSSELAQYEFLSTDEILPKLLAST